MKIIYITTISPTMNTFFKAHIKMLVDNGHCVDLACNDTGWPIDDFYKALGCKYHHVDFSRSPWSKDNVRAYGQLKKVIEEGNYDIVHCHTPTASAVTRLVCKKFRKKNGLKVFYTAHGFHFYKGAPLVNWMIYYPIEKYCSRFTDKLITINNEDYERAKAKFKAKEVHYIPGVGVDLSRFENIQVDRAAKRREIGVPEDAVLLFSVGELNENKNHQIIIRVLAKQNNPNIHYAVAGIGDKQDYLLNLAKELGVEKQFHLLGFRKDIAELDYIADVYCFPSYREGLSAALMEAMACGAPIICSSIRGNIDLINNSNLLFSPESLEQVENALNYVLESNRTELSQANKKRILYFSEDNVVSMLNEVYNFKTEIREKHGK